MSEPRPAILADPTRDDDIGSLKGVMSDHHRCIDCNVNTAPGVLTRGEIEIAFLIDPEAGAQQHVDDRSEIYIVRDNVWRKTELEGYGGCLCIGCLERRIGRRLKRRDFE